MVEVFTVVSSLKCYDYNLPRRCNDAIWHKVVFKQLGLRNGAFWIWSLPGIRFHQNERLKKSNRKFASKKFQERLKSDVFSGHREAFTWTCFCSRPLFWENQLDGNEEHNPGEKPSHCLPPTHLCKMHQDAWHPIGSMYGTLFEFSGNTWKLKWFLPQNKRKHCNFWFSSKVWTGETKSLNKFPCMQIPWKILVAKYVFEVW